MNTLNIPCPQCKADIPVTMELLLAGRSFECSNAGCDAKISIKAESNNQSINAYEALKKHKS